MNTIDKERNREKPSISNPSQIVGSRLSSRRKKGVFCKESKIIKTNPESKINNFEYDLKYNANLNVNVNVNYKPISFNQEEFITTLLLSFLNSKKHLIKSIYQYRQSIYNELIYCIVLKDDSLENTLEIYDFYDIFDNTNFSKSHTVILDFIDSSLESKLLNVEELSIG